LWPGICSAGNSVVVESKAVPPGAEQVTLGVYIANDTALRVISIPLEFREIESGAYLADTFAVTFQNRLAGWDIGDSSYSLKYFYPSRTFPVETCATCCDLDSNGKVWADPTDTIDFVSPDAFMYIAIGWEKPLLPAGDDGTPGDGTPSMLFTFNVTEDTGRFEVDTVCTWRVGKLGLAHEGEEWIEDVSFTKGIIEIIDSCACDCHGDPVCDSVVDSQDFTAAYGVAFLGYDPIPDANAFCPYETTDVDCDDDTDVLDVMKFNYVVNYGADPDTLFCNPCAP
jgi:hypothetical protein